MRIAFLHAAGLPALTLLVACTDQPTGPEPAKLVVVQAPSTVGVPGWELIDMLVVRAVDPAGTPRAGVAVTWTIRQGGGSIAPLAETTDADGYARAVWTLGSAAGPNKVRAETVEGSQADFASTGEAFRVEALAGGCGLVSGALWCWGHVAYSNEVPSRGPIWGHWDIGPKLLDDSHAYVEVATTWSSVCVLTADGDVWCATDGQPEVARVTGLPPIHGLVGGWRYCGLADADSTLWCWVVGGTPAQVFPGLAFRRMAVLEEHVFCGLLADSTASCWGQDPTGGGASATPVPVNGGRRFVELVVARGYGCGLEADGDVWCWSTRFNAPVPLDPMLSRSGAFGIAAGWDRVQAIVAGGQMVRWRGPGYSEVQVMQGLEGNPVDAFSNDGLMCVRLVDGEAYCYEDLWNNSSAIHDDIYSPVQPVRSGPVMAVRQ